MGELNGDDVERFTDGRLLGDNEEVQRMLAAALTVMRREAGWHVSPVLEETLILDGPGSRMLSLPTRKVVELTSVTEEGTTLSVADLRWPAGGPPGILERPIVVRKTGGGWWASEYQAIEVVMTHGYTEEEAADWRQAVLTLVDQMGSLVGVGRGESDLVSKKVDDVTYTWGNPYSAMAEGVLYSVKNILCNYELPRLEFL